MLLIDTILILRPLPGQEGADPLARIGPQEGGAEGRPFPGQGRGSGETGLEFAGGFEQPQGPGFPRRGCGIGGLSHVPP